VKSVDGYDSFITFTDDYFRYGYIYPIKESSEALDKFKIFKAEVENQHDKRIKIVWSDRGGGVTRVNSTNVLDEGLRIGETGSRMNSKVRLVEISVYRK
jgi:hypothetical protein